VQLDDTISTGIPRSDVSALVSVLNTDSQINDQPSDLHLLAINNPTGNIGFNRVTGVNLDAIVETSREVGYTCSQVPQTALAFDPNSHLIFMEPITEEAIDDNTATREVATITELHEIAHSFQIGEADDEPEPLPCGEVYSGTRNRSRIDLPPDETPERVNIGGINRRTWSIMRAGWGEQTLISNSGTEHYVFSLQELLTIERPDE